MTYTPPVWLVEEVPGVPENEQYYIRREGERPLLWQGPTVAAGREWAAANNVAIDFVERFEP